MDCPKLTVEQLAAITDEQQITGIRAAPDVALAAFDVWRQSPAWNRYEKHYQRWSGLVVRLRLMGDTPASPDGDSVTERRGRA